VLDARQESSRRERSESAAGLYARWLGDQAFSPNLSQRLPGYVDQAFGEWPKVVLNIRAANVGAYRVVERSPRIGGDPLVLMLGAPLGASVVGNILGSAVTDRLLTDELVNQEYWAVALALEIDGQLFTATNRRRKNANDEVSGILPQMIQFTADMLR
jgi:hypothetical protein